MRTLNEYTSADWLKLQADVLDPDTLDREGFYRLLRSRDKINKSLIVHDCSPYFIQYISQTTNSNVYLSINKSTVSSGSNSVVPNIDNLYPLQGQPLNLPFSNESFELVAMQGNFDMLSGDAVFLEMTRVLAQNGWLYLSMIYDSCCPWFPIENEELEVKICKIMELFSIEKLSPVTGCQGDSRAGRKLWHYAARHGLKVIKFVSSDWILFPKPKYTLKEQAVLKLELDFYYNVCSCVDDPEYKIDSEILTRWYNTRLTQIQNSSVSFILTHKSLIAEKSNNSKTFA